MNTYQLPNFSLDDYSTLLSRLKKRSNKFYKVSQMKDVRSENAIFLRHDIDFHLNGVEEMAWIEARHGIPATYYVLLTQHYNLMFSKNRAILRSLIDLGHEIGLHYDLVTYPTDLQEAEEHLRWEADLLACITGVHVSTITMHQPHLGHIDLFQHSDLFVNPLDPRYMKDTEYISDSCRAWRDERLLSFLGNDPPKRLLLLTHPELWLNGEIQDRMQFLNMVVKENACAQIYDYFTNEVRSIWQTHPATLMHDARIYKQVK